MKLGVRVGLGPGHIVLDGDPAPLPKRGTASPPIFGLYLLRPNGFMDQDATWYGGWPRPRRLRVRWGPHSLPKKGVEPPRPNFRPMFIVARQLDGSRWYLAWRQASAQATLCSIGTQLLPEKRAHPPHPFFDPCLLWPNGWMDEDALVTEVDLGPGHIVLDGVPALCERGRAAPLFSAHV